jgi:hypothetical protein
VSGKHHISDRARAARLRALVAASTLPLLVSCSSSSSVEYATDAFPSQSLVDLLKGSKNSPPAAPAAPTAPPAAPSATDAALPPPASVAPPAREPAPVSTTAAANPPPAAASPPEPSDPVATAFPSVSLIDLLKGERKPGSQ